jgi:hypothetical protein
MNKPQQDEHNTFHDKPKRKPGRPRLGAVREAWIGAHVSKIQRTEAHARAAKAGISVGAWIVKQCGLDAL